MVLILMRLHMSNTDSGLDESKGTVHTAHCSNESPTNLPSEACETSEPRNLLARIFHFKPEVKTLALRMRREEAVNWLFNLLQAHVDKGLKDIHRSKVAANEFSVTVDKKNCKFTVLHLIRVIANGCCRLWYQAMQVRRRRIPDSYRRPRYHSLRPPLHPKIGSCQLYAQSHPRSL